MCDTVRCDGVTVCVTPGMQAMVGQEEEAAALHANYTAAWRTFGWMPEAFHLDLTKVRPLWI